MFLDAALHAKLLAYFEGPRAAQTGLTVTTARRSARCNGPHTLADLPLLLSPTGRRIKPGTYRDHYFRKTLRQRVGYRIWPHLLRHEAVTRMMEAIHAQTESYAEEEAMITLLADIVGWKSGPEMAFYYAPRLKPLRARRLMQRLQTGAEDEVSMAHVRRADDVVRAHFTIRA